MNLLLYPKFWETFPCTACVKSVFSLSAGITHKDPLRGIGLGRQRTDLCYRQ